MNATNMPDWVDLEKLRWFVAEAVARQDPRPRRELFDAIRRSEMVVTADDEGWLLVTVEGMTFGRVHPTRVLRVPDHPEAN